MQFLLPFHGPPQGLAKSPQKLPRSSQGAPKGFPRAPHRVQRNHPRAPKEHPVGKGLPRDSTEDPSALQEAVQKHQECSKQLLNPLIWVQSSYLHNRRRSKCSGSVLQVHGSTPGAPRQVLRATQECPKRTQAISKTTRNCQRGLQAATRAPQHTSKSSRETCKRPPRGRKTAPRRFKNNPRPPKRRSKSNSRPPQAHQDGRGSSIAVAGGTYLQATNQC